MFNGRRQPSCGGTSRMTRECQVRICERLGVKFPGPTRQNPTFRGYFRRKKSQTPLTTDAILNSSGSAERQGVSPV